MDKLTVEKLKGKLKDIGASWNENYKWKPKKYKASRETQKNVKQQSCLRNKPGAREVTLRNPPLNIGFDREICQAAGCGVITVLIIMDISIFFFFLWT